MTSTRLHAKLQSYRLYIAVILATGVMFALPGASWSAPINGEISGNDVVGAEVPSLSTARSRAFHGPNGSLVAELFASPVNYEAGGHWHRIDTTLKSTSTDEWASTANSFALGLPARLEDKPISLTTQDASVGLQLDGAHGTPKITGETAHYEEALNETSVVYQSLTNGLKETLVLSGPDAPSTFRFHLSTDLTPEVNSDDSISLKRNGNILFTLPAPSLDLSAAGMASEELTPAITGSPLHYKLTHASDGWIVTLMINEEWRRATGRQYPIVIDPSITVNGSSGDCTVKSQTPTQSFCSASNLLVAKTSTYADNALLSFNLSAIPQNSTIDAANFGVDVESTGLFGPLSFEVSAVDASWSSPTWNTSRSGVSWSCAGGGFYGSGCTVSPEVPSAMLSLAKAKNNEYTYVNMPSLAQDLQNGLVPNYGIIMRKAEQTSEPVKLYSSETAHPPVLLVQYQPLTGQRSQYDYHNFPVTDQFNGSVNLATGNLELVQHAVEATGPDAMPINIFGYYDSLRARQNPTDYHEVASGWSLSAGRDVSLSTIPVTSGTGVFSEPIYAISGWLDRTEDGSNAPVVTSESYTPLAGITPGGDGLALHWQGAPKTTSCSEAVQSSTVADSTYFNTQYVQASGTCSQAEQILLPQKYVAADGNGISTKYSGPSGSLSEWSVTGGQKYVFEHTTTGKLTTITDPDTRHVEYGYETGTGYLSSITNADGKHTNFSYESPGQSLVTKITTPTGKIIHLSYEVESGRLAEVRDEDASLGNPKWAYAYNQPLSNAACIPQSSNQEARYCTIETDPNGNKVGYTFDAWGRLVGSIDPLGQQTSQGFSNHSLIHTDTVGTGASASTTSYAYQTTSETMSSTTAPTGNVSTIEYGSGFGAWLPTAVRNPQGHETDLIYPLLRPAVVSEVRPQLAQNPPGELNKDPAPEKEVFTYGTGECEFFGESGYPVAMVAYEDGRGAKTQLCYDAKGNVRETRPHAPLSHTTQKMDGAGLLLEGTDGAGHTAKYTYDGIGRVTKVEYGDASSVKYVYDADGKMTEMIDPTGITKYSYNSSGLLTEEVHPPGGSAGTTAYGYYAGGQLKEVTNAGGTTQYTYNANNELKTVTDSAGTTTFCYGMCGTNPLDQNPRNDLTEIDYPNGTKTLYAYDIGDRITSITTTGPEGTLQHLTYSYQEGTQDRALVQTVTDSVANTCSQYTYDYLDRLTVALTTFGTSCSGSQVSRYEYGYDADSNLVSFHHYGASGITICEGTQSMNLADELETLSNTCGTPSAKYTFDGAGNQTAAGSTAFGYNVRNQYTSQGTASFTEAGRTNNELTNNDGAEVSQTTLGIGATKPHEGTATYYTRTPEGTLIDERTPTGTYYYATDKLGSITRMTNSTGHQAQAYSYDPYGTVTATPEGGGPPNAFFFQGGYQVNGQQKNLLQFGARMYDPTTGRWTQQDPTKQLASPTEANGFGFAGDDPVNLTDPQGMCAWDKDLKPSNYHGGGYDYMEICSSTQHRVGYIRVRDNARRDNVRIRSKGKWQKVFDTYCGIIGGAALVPGVDVFGAPAEIGCAGYGVYRAAETIVEAI